MNPKDLDYGVPVLFTNYTSNGYHTSYSRNNTPDSDSLWMSLSSGINVARLQYRQLGYFSWDNNNRPKYNILRNYVQTPLLDVGAELSAGQLISAGDIFSGLSYDGLMISSDERMLPDSRRGYAPVINGIAGTVSTVTITQAGSRIYEQTVPPGPFRIDDLYPTSYRGDLYVEVRGADGSVGSFTVPYSSVSNSVRAGKTLYNVNAGKVRGFNKDNQFADITVQRGISNAVTLNSGYRQAVDYTAVSVGGVYSSYIGAVGSGLEFSTAKLPNDARSSGWMLNVNYSKGLTQTDTTFTLAAYRYSTEGYSDLSDVLGLRSSYRRDTSWYSDSYQQRSKLQLTLSQSLSSWGNLALTASAQDYHYDKGKINQLQATYNKSLANGVSFNFSAGRQKISGVAYSDSTETATSFSISVPLFADSQRPTMLTASVNHSGNGAQQYQSTLSGFVPDRDSMTYNMSSNVESRDHSHIFNASIQDRSPYVSYSISGAKGPAYWLTSASAQGSLVVHQGGILAGPYLSDTFGIVSAEGAEGARVYNSQQSRINTSGYALVPSLMPYSYNQITLDQDGMLTDAELIDSERRISPVSGAAVKMTFKTRTGVPALIAVRMKGSDALPLGSDVLNENNEVIGMSGQDGQIYVRISEKKGTFKIRWGNGKNEMCHLNYDISGMGMQDKSILRFDAFCQ